MKKFIDAKELKSHAYMIDGKEVINVEDVDNAPKTGAIPKELIEKRKDIVESLYNEHDKDTDFDKGIRTALKVELSFLKSLLK